MCVCVCVRERERERERDSTVSFVNMKVMVCVCIDDVAQREMFYLTTHSTHFIYGYMGSDIWLRTILIVRKETRWRHIVYTDRITHTTAFVTPVVEHWLEREIAQWVHPMKDRSDDPPHHERMLLPLSYVPLPDVDHCIGGFFIVVIIIVVFLKTEFERFKNDTEL